MEFMKVSKEKENLENDICKLRETSNSVRQEDTVQISSLEEKVKKFQDEIENMNLKYEKIEGKLKWMKDKVKADEKETRLKSIQLNNSTREEKNL